MNICPIPQRDLEVFGCLSCFSVIHFKANGSSLPGWPHLLVSELFLYKTHRIYMLMVSVINRSQSGNQWDVDVLWCVQTKYKPKWHNTINSMQTQMGEQAYCCHVRVTGAVRFGFIVSSRQGEVGATLQDFVVNYENMLMQLYPSYLVYF